MDERRESPGIVVSDSADVRLADVTLHHAGGMGVIAQRSTDLALDRVVVAPPVDESRMISTAADATHFVNCRGLIRMTDCRFENQMDDPTNIHGIYAKITAQPAPNELEVRLIHYQQFGLAIAAPRDHIALLSSATMDTLGDATVQTVTRVNKEITRLTLDQDVPDGITLGDAVENLTWTPDVVIEGCTCRGNRARGFLISTPGQVRIENNHLHVPGAAILIVSDTNYWFEAGAVRDVLIRGNHFDNCNHGIWGKATIQITTADDAPESTFHRNVRIEDNTFDAFDGRIVFARRVDGLTIAGNTINESSAYPARHVDAPRYDIARCQTVTTD